MKRYKQMAIGIAGAVCLASGVLGSDPDTAPAQNVKVAVPAGIPEKDAIILSLGPDGKLTHDQFLAQNNAANDPEKLEKLEMLFGLLDPDHSGVITMEQIMRLQQMAQTAEPPMRSAGPDDEPEVEPALPDISSIVPAKEPCPYAVVISAAAAALPEWKAVAEALVAKHKGVLVVYEGSVYNALPELVKLQPRYTAFVARTEILGRIFVARVHRLTRRLDNDPYTDTVWGIVSGDSPRTALRVAKSDEPKTVNSVISLTGVTGDIYDEIFTISDGKAGDWYRKNRDGKEDRGADGDADRIDPFVTQFSEMKPDAIVGSGHATEQNLEMCFGKGNTEIRNGKWVGVVNWRRPGAETREVPIPEDSHPRIFLGAGNCLIGNFRKRPDSMAAILIGRHNVNQFVGYTMPTWYGKGGWGTLGIWQTFAGTYSLAEAFFFNNQDITREMRSRFPASEGKILTVSERGEGMDSMGSLDQANRDEAGMMWDRDVVAFYGDPALRITHDPSKNTSKTRLILTNEGNIYRFTASAERETKGVVAMLFPKRIAGEIEVTGGKEYEPAITDDFILIPGATLKPGKPLQVEFLVRPVTGQARVSPSDQSCPESDHEKFDSF